MVKQDADKQGSKWKTYVKTDGLIMLWSDRTDLSFVTRKVWAFPKTLQPAIRTGDIKMTAVPSNKHKKNHKYWRIPKHSRESMSYWNVNIRICAKRLGQPKMTASVKIRVHCNQNLQGTTRQSGRAPDKALKINHYCLWQLLQWTRSDWCVVNQQLPTVWPNRTGRTDSLARHQLSSVGGNGQNISDRTC